MNLKRLQRLTERIARQEVSIELVSLVMHKREGRWVAAVDGGGHGELLSPTLAGYVVLRWFLPKGQSFPRHHHPFAETMIMERGRCVSDGKELGPGADVSVLAHRTHTCEALEDSSFLVVWDQNRLEWVVDQTEER